jgi:hypothetical protein
VVHERWTASDGTKNLTARILADRVALLSAAPVATHVEPAFTTESELTAESEVAAELN